VKDDVHDGPVPPGEKRGNVILDHLTASRLGNGLGRSATLAAFLLMVAFFWAQHPDTFGTWENFKSIFTLAAPLLILSVGLTIVLTVGEFDLSFVGVVNLAALVIAKYLVGGGHGVFLAIVLALAVGLAGGLIAGLLVAADRASSFIVTLALNTIWGGLALGISNAKYIPIPNLTFTNISLSEAGLPVPVWISIGVVLVGMLVMQTTVFGRDTRAVGSNRLAARLAGVRVNVTRIGTFALLGLCTGLAAMLLASSEGAYTPGVGSGLLIPPYVAVFFGISVLGVGRFTVLGTVVGALFIQTLQTGLTFEGVSSWVSNVVIGTVLLVILFLSSQLRKS
jgi:ribose/xylose/arabinose/galactoside ABC-type transport system permease subunit